MYGRFCCSRCPLLCFCRCLLADLPSVFLMPPAFFSSPLLFVKVGLRHRSCACTLQHAVPRAEALFQFPVIQDICLHGLSAVFLSEVSDKLQEFFVCHFFIWRSNLIQLLDFLCCCQVRIVLYALFYFSLIHLLPSLVSMLPFVPAGGVTCWHRPVRMKRIFSIKKTMIILTIAFVSGIPAAYMPESLNAETSHAYHAQVSFISVVCRSSDLSIHVRRILLAQTHCFSLLSEP